MVCGFFKILLLLYDGFFILSLVSAGEPCLNISITLVFFYSMGSRIMKNPVKLFFGLVFLLIMCLPAGVFARGTGAYYDLGVYAFEEGDYEGALKYFKKVLDENSGDIRSSCFLGKTYIRLEKYHEAENILKPVMEKEPDTPGLKSDWAYLQFKLERYSTAAEFYADLADADPDDAFANYYAGISLYRSGRYAKAADYLVRAAEKSPTVKDNGYFFAGICYQKIGDPENAVRRFAYLRDYGRTDEMRNRAQEWLSSIEKQKSKDKPYSLYAKLAYQYDNNVTLEPVDDEKPADEDDYVSILFFSGRYDLIRTPRYQAGMGYSHYQTRHNDLSDYDMTAFIGSIYAKYKTYPAIWSLTYYPTYYQLDGDGFLMRHHLKPELMIKASDNLLLRMGYNYYGNNHIEDGNRTGHTNKGEFEAIYGFKNGKGYVSGRIDFEDNRSSHPDYDYSRAGAQVGVSVDMLERVTVKATGETFDKTYDNTDSFFNVKRNDTRYTGTLSLFVKMPVEWLTVSGEIEYIKNNSNIGDYEYREFITTLSVSATY